MCRKAGNSTWPLFGALAIVLGCPATWAGPKPVPVVDIDCPPLDEEARSAVEARLRADMAVRAVGDGSFSISCGDDGVSLRWRPRATALREASVQMGNAGSLVDRILETAVSLLEEPEPAQARPSAEPPSPPAVTPAAAPAPAPIASTPKRPNVLAATAAGSWQLWPGQGVQTLGPSLGLQLRLGQAVTADAWAAAHWGLHQPQGFETRTLSLGLGASAFLESSRTCSIGAGGSVMQLRVRAGSELEPGSRQTTSVGGWMNLLIGTQVAALRVDLGPQVAVWARSHSVVVDGRDVFSQPVFVPELMLRFGFPATVW